MLLFWHITINWVRFRIQPQYITNLRQEHPQAIVIAHPECRPEVIAIADEVLSTGGLCRYASRNEVKEIIVGTEIGIIHRLRKENPDKKFIPISEGEEELFRY